jgi:AraC family transcriptional regulator of adaptative response/methylated-DNA-[protein]-cysteine methyltransferase
MSQNEGNDEYWQAVQNRNANYDGTFYYGVLTTGVYCKPSCKTRLALRKNVRFFNTPEEAKNFGLRACKKCNPNKATSVIADVVHELCRYIDTHIDETLSLAHIARKSGYSTSHIQKAFIALIGSSPKAYQQSLRQQKLRTDLRTAPNVTGAIYSAGYGSTSRVYEKLGQYIGMTPRQYRQGGKDVIIHYASGTTNLGVTMIAATGRGICFLQFGQEEQSLLAELHKEFPHAAIEPMPTSGAAQFEAWMNALEAYLNKKQQLNGLPIDLRGTAFQMLVWRYLQTIPTGEVRSYTEVAQGIGKPKAVRAVASACAHNRIGIIIPCHRVLRGDGGLAGYRWGLERKRTLIDLERHAHHE